MNEFIDRLKQFYRNGGMEVKIVFFTSLIFLVLELFFQINMLFKADYISRNFLQYTMLYSDPELLLYRPWTLITNIFLHADFFHLLGNMLMVFYFGQLVRMFFNAKKVLAIFVIGGVAGGILQILSKNIFPVFQDLGHYPIMGASGGAVALVVAAALYRPQTKLNLFGVVPVSLGIIAAVIVGIDFLNMGRLHGVARFAHIGGAIFGFLFTTQYKKGKDITKWFDNLISWLVGLFSRKPKPRMKVKYSRARDNKQQPPRDDYEYNENKVNNEEKLNVILDKIKKKGYDGLTKAEKDFLARQ